MGIQLETLEQVIEFVAKMKPEAAKAIVDQYGQTLKVMEEKAKDSNEKMTDHFSKYIDRQRKLSQGSVKEFATDAQKRLQAERDMLAKAEKEIEKSYKKQIDMLTDNRKRGHEATKGMVEKDLRLLEEYWVKTAELEKRKRQVGGAQGGSPQGGGAMRQGAGMVADQMGIPTNPQAVALFMIREFIAGMARAREQEKLGTALGGAGAGLGATFGPGSTGAGDLALSETDELVAVVQDLKVQFPSLAEEIEKTAMIFAREMPAITTNAGEMRQALSGTVAVSKNLSISMEDAAKMQAEFMQKFHLSAAGATDQLLAITKTGRDLAMGLDPAKGGLDIQDFVGSVMKMADALLPLGGDINDAASMVKKFSKQINDGVISVQDLVKATTGLAKADPGTRAFVGMQVEMLGKEGFGDLATVLKGLDPDVMADAVEGLISTPMETLKELQPGLDPVQLQAQSKKLQEKMQQSPFKIAAELAMEMSPGDDLNSRIRRRTTTQQLQQTFGVLDMGQNRAGRMAVSEGVPGAERLDLSRMVADATTTMAHDIQVMRQQALDAAKAGESAVDKIIANMKQMVTDLLSGMRTEFTGLLWGDEAKIEQGAGKVADALLRGFGGRTQALGGRGVKPGEGMLAPAPGVSAASAANSGAAGTSPPPGSP